MGVRALCSLALVALLGACGGASNSRGASAPARPPEHAPPRRAPEQSPATNLSELHADAQRFSAAGMHERAAAAFDRMVELDPQGPLAPEAAFQAAAERDLGGQLRDAAESYERFVRRFPKSPATTTALARATRLWTALEQWQRAESLARTLLARESELGPFHRVIGYAASALGRLAADDEQAATTFVERGRQIVDAHSLDAAGRIPRDVAALYFALGELRRRRAERIRFVPPPLHFAGALEERCQVLLDAQSAYSDAMRAYDAHWSTMAGVRVAELYGRLHEDLMQIPIPASADTPERRRLFLGAMRLRYAVLLEKGLGMLAHTLAMAEREGERSAWVERARAARGAIEAELERERKALAALPYSRAVLEDAFRRLEQPRSPAPTAQPTGAPRPARGP